MRAYRLLASGLLLASLTLPFSAYALPVSVPVGGKILGEIPCLNGGFLLTVGGLAGIGSGLFVWSVPPITLTYLYGPPRIGTWVLGEATVPYPCVLPVFPPVTVFGLHILQFGSSLSV